MKYELLHINKQILKTMLQNKFTLYSACSTRENHIIFYCVHGSDLICLVFLSLWLSRTILFLFLHHISCFNGHNKRIVFYSFVWLQLCYKRLWFFLWTCDAFALNTHWVRKYGWEEKWDEKRRAKLHEFHAFFHLLFTKVNFSLFMLFSDISNSKWTVF